MLTEEQIIEVAAYLGLTKLGGSDTKLITYSDMLDALQQVVCGTIFVERHLGKPYDEGIFATVLEEVLVGNGLEITGFYEGSPLIARKKTPRNSFSSLLLVFILIMFSNILSMTI